MHELFSETVHGYPNVPTPRPTQAHTYNFGYAFMGAWLLDGECKSIATYADIGFMVLHCMDQLVTQDVALCMFTTSDWFQFYRSMKKMDTNCIVTTYCKLDSYKLWQVLYEDRYRETDGIQKLPTLLQEVLVLVVGGINNEITEWSEYDESILDSWQALRSELIMFLYAVSDAIDILVAHFSSLNLTKVETKRAKSFTV